MRILFLDVETTGLNPLEDRVVEIGANLYCTDTKRTLRSCSFLTTDDTIKISPQITAINKISQEMLDKNGVDFKSVLPLLTDNFVRRSDFLCAHNAPFDRGFLEAELKRFGYPIWNKPWIDTCVDLPFPETLTTRKLTYLAVEHGFLNPFPHTALSDVLTTQKILGEYDVAKIISRSETPNITIVALVDYANREKASKRGYRWAAGTKRWMKVIKETELALEREAAGFEIEVLK